MTQSHQKPPAHDDEPLPVEPGHVRQRQHYEALLREMQSQQQQSTKS